MHFEQREFYIVGNAAKQTDKFHNWPLKKAHQSQQAKAKWVRRKIDHFGN